MKKLFCFVLLFAITLASSFALVACDGNNNIKSMMFTYNRTTYKSGANIVFTYGDNVNFNKDTVKFIGVGSIGNKSDISITDLSATYEYAELGSSTYTQAGFLYFFEGETTTPGCGIYRFTFSKNNVSLQFTLTVVKKDVINNYRLEFVSDSEVVTKSIDGSYIINATNASLIRWQIANMADKEKQQLGEYPELYVMTAEQYQESGNRENYNGTLIERLYSDILGTPGDYYIYGKFTESSNYKGGNTNATHVIVN